MIIVCVHASLGMADYQVLPPGLTSKECGGLPNDFQLKGNTLLITVGANLHHFVALDTNSKVSFFVK